MSRSNTRRNILTALPILAAVAALTFNPAPAQAGFWHWVKKLPRRVAHATVVVVKVPAKLVGEVVIKPIAKKAGEGMAEGAASKAKQAGANLTQGVVSQVKPAVKAAAAALPSPEQVGRGVTKGALAEATPAVKNAAKATPALFEQTVLPVTDSIDDAGWQVRDSANALSSGIQTAGWAIGGGMATIAAALTIAAFRRR